MSECSKLEGLTPQYDLFISYSRLDSAVVHNIYNWLTIHGVRCWMDVDGVESGDAFQSILARAIQDSSALVFFSSVNSNVSKWTLREVVFADELNKPIIPIRIDDTPYDNSVRLLLSGIDWIDFTREEYGSVVLEKIRKRVLRHSVGREDCLSKNVKIVSISDGLEMRFRRCLPGGFEMGSPLTELNRSADELLHKVKFTKEFWLGETQVTQKQWESVMGYNPSLCQAPNHPVESVSWYDCVDFMQKFFEKTGSVVRLPTEAEWEYACRAGSSGAYGGTGVMDEMGWYANNRREFGRPEGTCPVGLKKPNDWGFYDMHGNVWEWCMDCYDAYAEVTVVNPEPVSSGAFRIRRGGSCQDEAGACRSAYRFVFSPECRDAYIGFRVLLEKEGLNEKDYV